MRRSSPCALLLLCLFASGPSIHTRQAHAAGPARTAQQTDPNAPQDPAAPPPKPVPTPVTIGVYPASLADTSEGTPTPVKVNLSAPPAKPAAPVEKVPLVTPVSVTGSAVTGQSVDTVTPPVTSAPTQTSPGTTTDTSLGEPTPARPNPPAPVYPKHRTTRSAKAATHTAAKTRPATVSTTEPAASAPATLPAADSVPTASTTAEPPASQSTPAPAQVEALPSQVATPAPAPASESPTPSASQTPASNPAAPVPSAAEPAAQVSAPAPAPAAEPATAETAPPLPEPPTSAIDLGPTPTVFGYRDFARQQKWDSLFLAVPDAKLAGEELKQLTSEPHWASSPEDYRTAQYVAGKFRAAGLDTKIVPFRVYLNAPLKIEIAAFDKEGRRLMSGPTPEHVDPKAYGGDPSQDDPRILPPFNGSSASGDVTAAVVYANYGTREDFKQLEKMGVSVKGKIVLVRYGGNYRGVKVYLAQQYGAAGVLIYSDPADDGYDRGDMYPRGPFRPATGVQRGSVSFLPLYPGDPETPGVASTPELSDSDRVLDPTKMNQPSIPANPLSYQDAAPILHELDGPETPREWQGGLPFTYHVGGTDAVKVHMLIQQDYKLRTIWDVIGTIPGWDTRAWVVAGNHRDAWVFGAVDPSSGTAAMLETVHGLGELLKKGWKPQRSIVIASWDAEEEGLIGSTEWVELHAQQMAHAVVYLNMDEAVEGPNFSASALPSLRQFVRDATQEVPSPSGGSVYEQWKLTQQENPRQRARSSNPFNAASNAPARDESVRVGELGSGSDYTPFLQHAGVPSTNIVSSGPDYGVYHSAFDDFNYFQKFIDPTFVYEQEMARVFGVEILHMADTDVLPYDYKLYGQEIVGYLKAALDRATAAKMSLNFSDASAAAQRFAAAGEKVRVAQQTPPSGIELAGLNFALRDAETALLSNSGLPRRPWYKHTIYAPGEFTGYAAVVIPGVNEAIDDKDADRAQAQLLSLTRALNRAAKLLEDACK